MKTIVVCLHSGQTILSSIVSARNVLFCSLSDFQHVICYLSVISCCIVLTGSWSQEWLLFLVEFCLLDQYSSKCKLNDYKIYLNVNCSVLCIFGNSVGCEIFIQVNTGHVAVVDWPALWCICAGTSFLHHSGRTRSTMCLVSWCWCCLFWSLSPFVWRLFARTFCWMLKTIGGRLHSFSWFLSFVATESF